MESTIIKYIVLGDLAEILGFRAKDLHEPIKKKMLGVRRFISNPDGVVCHIDEGCVPPECWGIIIRDNDQLLDDYLKFIFDCGVFYSKMLDKKNGRLPLHILKKDLESYEIPMVDYEIQMAISKLELAWQWAKNHTDDGFKYAGLRVALLDEVRRLVALELYLPDKFHEWNINAIESMLELGDLLSSPHELFIKLALEQTSMMNQVKRFRSIVFEK